MRTLDEVMVVVGLEGALLDEAGRIPRANREVVRLFCSRGGRFTVASDRTPDYVMRMLQDIPVTDPVICCGGATIYDPKEREYIAQRVLNTQQAEEVLESVLTVFPQVGVIVQQQDGTLCVVRATEFTQTYLQREGTNYLIAQAEDVQQPWVRMIFAAEADQLDQIEQYAARHKNHTDIQIFRLSENVLHVTGKGVSKGAALRELSLICEMSQPDIYGIGGSYSDQSLLQIAGHTVAMPGASVRVKLASDLVTRLEQSEGGTAEFLYQLIKEYDS